MAALLLSIFACSWAAAETSVWQAKKGDEVIYLGGTFHLLRKADYPLPPEFERAYRAADLILFETDIARLQEQATQQKLLSMAMYGDGSTIDRHLSPKVYKELTAYCAANGLPLQAMRKFKPSFLIVTLTVLEMNRLGAVQQGVDQFFYRLALKDGKRVEGLESVDEQLDYLVNMADGFEDDFVTYSLNDLNNSSQQFEELSTAWRSGNDVKLDELMSEEMKALFPKLYRKLIVERNRRWLPIIESRQNPRKTKFVLVGAGHLVGPDGIVAALKKKGYKVEKL